MALMGMLQKGDSRDYLRYTDDALELRKWIRQFLDAVKTTLFLTVFHNTL